MQRVKQQLPPFYVVELKDGSGEIVIDGDIHRTVNKFYNKKDYAQLSNYRKYLATQEGTLHELQYACAALDVRRGGVWYSKEEEIAWQKAQCWAMRDAEVAEEAVPVSQLDARAQAEIFLAHEAEIEAYWRRLERHDWFACFSDSYAVTLAGEQDMRQLEEDARGDEIKEAMLADYTRYINSSTGPVAERLPKPQFEAYLA